MHEYRRRTRRGASRQRGAVLIISLILIFVLSLAGVSSMRNSALEQQMAVNSILSSDVLQAAESANEVVLNDQRNLARAYESDSITLQNPLGDDSPFASRVTLEYVGEGNAVGGSLNAAQGSNSFAALRYVSSGIARLDDARVSRQVDQGVYRSAPQ